MLTLKELKFNKTIYFRLTRNKQKKGSMSDHYILRVRWRWMLLIRYVDELDEGK